MIQDHHIKQRPLAGLTGMMGGAGGFFYASTGPSPITATGGTTATPGDGYKYHFWDNGTSGNFVVQSGNNTIHLLLIAKGASGGGHFGGGGGAGAVYHNTEYGPIGPGTYYVHGGGGPANDPALPPDFTSGPGSQGLSRVGGQGESAMFGGYTYSTNMSGNANPGNWTSGPQSGNPFPPSYYADIYVWQGGQGGKRDAGPAGQKGGSGGGGAGGQHPPAVFGDAQGDPYPGTQDATSPVNGFGHIGGHGKTGSVPAMGGGGGGAGGVGHTGMDSPYNPPATPEAKYPTQPNAPLGRGGAGIPISWIPSSYGVSGGAGRSFAGGGGGGGYSSGNPGGPGGGGDSPGGNGVAGTGSGGGGAIQNNWGGAGSGGSGFVAIRYAVE